jgi:hypothetical protein
MGARVAAAIPARGFATEKQIAMRIVATSNLKKVGSKCLLHITPRLPCSPLSYPYSVEIVARGVFGCEDWAVSGSEFFREKKLISLLPVSLLRHTRSRRQ